MTLLLAAVPTGLTPISDRPGGSARLLLDRRAKGAVTHGFGHGRAALLFVPGLALGATPVAFDFVFAARAASNRSVRSEAADCLARTARRLLTRASASSNASAFSPARAFFGRDFPRPPCLATPAAALRRYWPTYLPRARRMRV